MTAYDPFVGLHVHSEYSFLDGRQTVPTMVGRAVELGQTALAITDHAECSGHVEFEKECKRAGIKPIFGMEGYLVHDVAEHKEMGKQAQKEIGHIILLAQNEVGLKNIWKLSTTGYKQSYYKQVCDWQNFRQYNEGVIATDACLLSWMARAILLEDQHESARQVDRLMENYLSIFGDRFFMELHVWQIVGDGGPLSERSERLNSEMSMVNQAKVEIAKRYGVPLIVVNDAHYDRPEEARNHALIWEMTTNSDQGEKELAAAHMMSSDEILYWMGRHGISEDVTREAINNTRRIADMCENIEIERRTRIPLLTGSVEGDVALYKTKVEEGYQRKYVDKGKDTPDTRARLDHENDQIISKGFAGYTIIVADYTLYAKGSEKDAPVANVVGTPWEGKKRWLVGPTRGSAGGAMPNYCIGITEADPYYYDIPFPRYIDPGRVSFPDIDLDFPQSKRPAMKDYLRWKYGEGNVALIGTFQKIGHKQAVKDLGRAMKVPYEDAQKISKLIEQVKAGEVDEETGEPVDITWEDIITERGGELQPWLEKYPTYFKHMQELLGIKRQHGTHPSGVLISPVDLFEELPLRVNKSGELVTQFEMNTIEELGFIKFDILGIRHLDTMMKTDELVHGEHDPDRFYDMTFEQLMDGKTQDLFAAGDLLGIFTVETASMIGGAKRMKPRSERDVSHLVSILRPGVMKAGGVDRFFRRVDGEEIPETPHPMTDEILKNTYGVFVYQDQVLKAVQVCAGYSYTESDKFRKILGKKKVDQMKKEKDTFIARCLSNPDFVSQSTYHSPRAAASKIWDQIEPAGTYSFNLAHALGYGLMSWWEAYLKAHHFYEHMTALMITDSDRVPEYLRSLRMQGLAVLPPDINESDRKFKPVSGGVMFGLDSVKGVGEVVVDNILPHRPFASLADFYERVPTWKVNRGHVVNLISVGAFDSMIAKEIEEFGLDARNMLLREYFALRADKKDVVAQFKFNDHTELARLEELLVGTYITRDPLDRYMEPIAANCVASPEEVDKRKVGEVMQVGGVITRIKVHQSKKPGPNYGRNMAFMDVEWLDETYNVTLFYDGYQTWKPFLEVGAVVVLTVERLARGVHMIDLIRLDWLLDGKEQ